MRRVFRRLYPIFLPMVVRLGQQRPWSSAKSARARATRRSLGARLVVYQQAAIWWMLRMPPSLGLGDHSCSALGGDLPPV